MKMEMKKIIIILCLITAFCDLMSQEVISEAIEIEIQEDTLYFLKRTIVSDNETSYPDTSITRTLLGDSTAATNYLFVQGVEGQQQVSARMAQAFLTREKRAAFNELDDLYETIAGEQLTERIEDEYFGQYNATYRVRDIQGDSTFLVDLIRIGSNERYRFEHQETGERWAVLPRSRNNFQVNNFFGETRVFYWDRITRANNRKVFKTELFVEGGHRFIITKL
jgi:hypothetical protein